MPGTRKGDTQNIRMPGATGGTPPVRVMLSEGTGRARPAAPGGRSAHRFAVPNPCHPPIKSRLKPETRTRPIKVSPIGPASATNCITSAANCGASATNCAPSATSCIASATNRDASATNRDASATNRDASATNRDASATNRDASATRRNASATNSSASATSWRASATRVPTSATRFPQVRLVSARAQPVLAPSPALSPGKPPRHGASRAATWQIIVARYPSAPQLAPLASPACHHL
jgi:hypothetical protein